MAKKNIMFAINTLNGALKLYQTKKDNFSTCYWSVDMAICMWQSATYSRFDSTFYFYNNSIKYLNESLDLCRNYNIEQPEHSITISYINYELRKLTDTNPFYRVFSTTLAKNKKNSKLSDDFFYDCLHVLEKLQLPMGSDSIITYTNSTSYSSDITALKNARLVLKKRKRPIALSYANNNLALLLLNKSLFVNGTEIDKNLQKASEILSNNSKTITKVEYPQDWALSQNKLGLINILHSINQNNHKSKKHLNTAIKIFNEVLSVYKKKYFPSGFAETMMYLGIAYKELGQLEVLQNSDYYFLHALKSFNSANEIYSSEFRPLNWLEVQYNLSETYYFLGNTDKAKKIIHDTEIKLFQ
ncbi:MAG: hypothetical protein GY932_10990 [Arcobacter sp.]|nr:hypothetical protein [Arcobacter sp.]